MLLVISGLKDKGFLIKLSKWVVSKLNYFIFSNHEVKTIYNGFLIIFCIAFYC